PQCEALRSARACLVVFTGPNCYVSPSWYSEHPNVPTWNYLSVHAYGPVDLLDDEGLEQTLIELTLPHEASVRGNWRYEDLPSDFKAELLREIRGFSVRVARLEAKAKLSQNRIPEDRERVTRALLDSSDPRAREVARGMAKKHSG